MKGPHPCKEEKDNTANITQVCCEILTWYCKIFFNKVSFKSCEAAGVSHIKILIKLGFFSDFQRKEFQILTKYVLFFVC